MLACTQRVESTSQRGAPANVRPAPEIFDPLTAELVSTDDIDGLIDLYQRLRAVDREIATAKLHVQRTLAAKTNGEARTRRLQGFHRRVRIDMPEPGWDQSRLRQAWREYPALREQYLRIETISVRVREFKKLVNMTGPVDLELFRAILVAAQKPATGAPRLTVEV